MTKALRSALFLILLVTAILSFCGCTPKLSQSAPASTAPETEEFQMKTEAMTEEATAPETTGETAPAAGEMGDLVKGKLRFTLIGGTRGDNDAAAWGGYLFKFNGKGWCYVYDLNSFSEEAGKAFLQTQEKTPYVNAFKLHLADTLPPHSNAVVFGTEKYDPNDEFPLLYCNIYNNFKEEADQKKGMLCAYRITRTKDNKFSSRLVQILRIGFTDDKRLWLSENGKDVRPFGNFVIDRETNTLYAFTMRDEDKTTRYFSFRMPSVTEGEENTALGARLVTLKEEDILSRFTAPYQHYMQGADFEGGNLYTVEGRTENDKHPAVMRITSPTQKKELRRIFLPNYVADIEPEVITFWDGKCYYGDVKGNLYLVEGA